MSAAGMLDRRTVLTLGIGTLLGAAAGSVARAAGTPLRVEHWLAADDPSSASSADGAALAAAEAARAAELLGGEIVIELAAVRVSGRDAGTITDARNPAAVVVGLHGEAGRIAVESARRRGALLVETRPALDEPGEPGTLRAAATIADRTRRLVSWLVRERGARRFAFAVPDGAAGARIRALALEALAAAGGEEVTAAPIEHAGAIAAAADVLFVTAGDPAAIAEAASEAPGALVAAPVAAEGRVVLHVAEWHGELFRYGASELNERAEERSGTALDAQGWLAWMAVRAVADAALRERSIDPARLEARLLDLALDGHKGRRLRFDAESRALSQPLYVVGRDRAKGRRTTVLGELA